ncbi:MAG: holo-ACP synthase [Microthrixaceae bacterium]
MNDAVVDPAVVDPVFVTAPAPLHGVLGLGTDLVEVERMRRALDRQPGLRTRLFTVDEWDYAARHHDPHPHLAARFAAKEAVMKALGRGMSSMGFAEIEVTRSSAGVPAVRLSGSAATIARESGVTGWHLSLTHTDLMAQAVAIAVGDTTASGDATAPDGATALGDTSADRAEP